MSQASRPKVTKLQNETTLSPDSKQMLKDHPPSIDRYIVREKYEILLERLYESGISKNYIFLQTPRYSTVDLDFFIPVNRTTLETINPNGFTPYDKKQEELLYKYFVVDLVESNNPYVQTKEDIEKSYMLKEQGIVYLKSGDINFIFNTLREIK